MTRFNNRQIDMISELCKEIGVVALASVAIPFFIDVDNSRLELALLGMAITVTFWYMAIRLRR